MLERFAFLRVSSRNDLHKLEPPHKEQDGYRHRRRSGSTTNLPRPKNWDELRDYAKRLTTYRVPGDPRSGIRRLGFAPNFGNSWLYMYAWQAGGEFLSPDRKTVTLAERDPAPVPDGA